jgi:hypothetical protein
METRDFLAAALSHLATYGLTRADLDRDPLFPGQQDIRADAVLTLAAGPKRLRYVVEEKRTLTPTTLGATMTNLHKVARAADRPALLVTDYLTAPLAEKLKAQGQQFVDAAGNAYLEGKGILIWVCGRKRPAGLKPRPGGAFTAGGIKVLFALLCDPALVAAPQRRIAAAAGVALGTVTGVLGGLAADNYLLGKGRRARLIALPRLLDDWTLAYARTLYPRTLLRTLTTPHFENWKTWDLAPHRGLWGAEPAAQLLVGHLHPGELTIYTRNVAGRLLAEHRMTEPGPGATQGLVRFRDAFWGEPLEYLQIQPVVHPLLVYADLLAAGDGRGIETAEIVREKHLAGLLEHN